ncbi:MAG: rhomboid family intramembrane serine protease [Saprospiraceae bacterium]|nr:rhomboid family intramembrane serine protease [Saprospiraceae bacterium]
MTIIIVIVTALISYYGFERVDMKRQLMLYPFAIKNRGEYYRFLTHGFVHANWNHLLINMFVLFQFGTVVEHIFATFSGQWSHLIFVLFYLSAIVFSSLVDYAQHQNNPAYGALGASGATSATLIGYVMIAPWQWFIFPPLPAILMVVAYLWYSNYMSKRGGDNIAHNAHFYGAVYGIVFFVLYSIFQAPDLLESFWIQLIQGPNLPF